MNQLIDVTDNPNIAVNDMVTARNMAETLHKHYPGHLWAVTCEGTKGIATVRNMALSGNWGFVLKLSRVYSDTHLRCVVKSGGELLERFNLARGLAYQDKIEGLPQIASGTPVFDPSEAKTRPKKDGLIVQAWRKTRGYIEDKWNKPQP